MSNVQSSSYETYESHGPDGTSRPSVAHDAGTLPYGTGAPPYGTEAETLPYGAGTPPYEAETLPYGVYADTVHADTYRPAYAARTVPDRRPAEQDGPFSGAGAAGEGGSRRAVRRRRAADRPGSLRRLVPQALVVAFLAGGTSAFVAKDKAIELTVDGRPRTLHTFADDVSELLADEGVAFGAHDVVAPAPGTALSSGDEVAVHYGRPVALTLDGRRRQVWTTARTVDGALQQLGVRAEGAYVSTSRSQRIGRQGLELDVRTERTVTIMADGRTRTIRTNAATVGEAVEQAGITLRGEDTTSVDASSFPRDGQTVTVLRVTGSTEVREVPVPFRVHRVEDPSLFRGTEVVERAGRPGTRRITYALRTVNGVRQRPRLLRTEVVREPRDQVVKVGTKAMPTSVAGAEGLNCPF
ncbi:ubiquitin-like domain-containing protein [Streptomyces scabiei]|uniref:ubiquitin-like domain-containing protein n=1 Tax=Streptomyces scabiei TaxID=1930 RepID=UPI0029A17B06|nr:ubiquitin-like domain-containing protein [Streptomyces scabiei]MDX2691484.1 ubiquitin-like domain-containing protein [Streptomyces scabiei]